MAQLNTKFDATAHDTEQRGDYAELPNGIYRMEVEASEVKPTKDGSGTLLKVTCSVIDPEDYRGRKLFNQYNLENKSSEAQRIGQQQFASLCRAIGVTEVSDSEELHFRPFTVTVKLGKPSKDGQYPARAEIKRYWFEDEAPLPEPAIDDVQPSKPVAANQNQRPAANQNAPASKPAATGSRPWAKK
ncbi:DUF669 domain-containing protein [Mesorhizobium sp.]|uniref:DUF669 domain-containing protein n=1 Tax=Mesorhizobium sp. TaxID=1871066 RepID=UPI001205C580|nr:DUF669 domain-containing protein [Mesorhizobium sp.]TIN83127.1 MAG: DUF669 domain-containing protein [Mesorhizobium sp.]